MVRSRRRAYYEPSRFPELLDVQAHWREILDEARIVFRELGPTMDEAHGPSASYILPLVPEAEDRNVIADDVYRRARELAPLTNRLLSQIPYVVAYAVSKVVPGKHIPEHEHWNPHLVALLCLQDGGGSYLVVGGERHDFRTGGLTVFDYTLPHEVKNDGHEDRLVLLVVIDPKRVEKREGFGESVRTTPQPAGNLSNGNS